MKTVWIYSCQVPTAEKRVHRLVFDLSAYGKDFVPKCPDTDGFHLKLFGSYRNRYMSIAIQRGDSSLVKSLRLAMDPSVSQNYGYRIVKIQKQTKPVVYTRNVGTTRIVLNIK